MSDWRHILAVLDGRFDALHSGEKLRSVNRVSLESAKGTLPRMSKLRALMRDHAPDLILTYNWGSMDGIVTALATGHGPIIHIEDGFGADEATRLKQRRTLARRVLLRHVAATVVPSRTLHATCQHAYHVPEGRLHYIPNGIDTDRFSSGSAPELRAALQIPLDAVVIGAVGRLRPEKNLTALLRRFAAATLTGAYLVVVGEGECDAELKQAASDLRVADRVRFLGGRSDVANLYRIFDVFAMSSTTEQMPMALLEAMASHLPAICTNVGDTIDMVSEANRPYIFPVDDEIGYVSGLRTLAGSQDLRGQLGIANRRLAVSNFSLGQMVTAHRTLYEQVMARRVR